MLLSISTTHRPATDLGFLLLKNPDNLNSFELSFGKAHVFFPEANEEKCTACLLLDVDSVTLVRGKGHQDGIEQYVNDRPYVASSFMSVAIAQVYGTALSGRTKHRPELVDMPIPLTVTLSALPCRGGEQLLKNLFEPLGYEIKAERLPLDAKFPDWGDSRYYSLELKNTVPLKDLLKHLYVLIPVMDDDKHYFVGQEEVDKLLRHGGTWLAAHPAKEMISKRYLNHKFSLAQLALNQLAEQGEDCSEEQVEQNTQEEEVERPLSLNEQRIQTVLSCLLENSARSVIDMGCGEGRYLKALLEQKEFDKVAGVDVSPRVLERAADRLRLERMPERKRERLSLFQGSLVYKDERLSDFDAAICIEVIEHMDLSRLPSFEKMLFQYSRPKLAIVTTPNSEYNAKFETLPAGKMRHADHRFEWTRAEFEEWANRVANTFGYSVEYRPIGPVDELLGAPTQMALFKILTDDELLASSTQVKRGKNEN